MQVRTRTEEIIFNSFHAAQWIRKTTMQGFAEAQYEFGEMFRRGLFCK
jgi:TPR repeat protein